MSQQYYASTGNITGSTSAQNFLSIQNPSTSTISVLIRTVNVAGFATTTSSTVFYYHFGRVSSGPTGGTALTIQQQESDDPAPQGIVTLSPTITLATGEVWCGSPGVVLGSLLGGAAYVNPYSTYAFTDFGTETNGLVLAAGEAAAITVDANTTNWNHAVNIVWIEY